MATTTAAAFAAALRHTVQAKVLANLRAQLVFADPAFAEKGTFDRAADTLMFVDYPDLSTNTTPLTEGSPPTAKALTMGTVTVDTTQYGDLVDITDLAKIKAPNDIADIAAERITRQAAESLDLVARDVIAAGGTAYYQAGDTTRAGLASTDLLTSADLQKLFATMSAAKLPKFPDGTYKLLVHPAVAYDLRADTTSPGGWLATNQYARPAEIMSGEIGRLHGFRIIEVNNAPTFASTTTVYASMALCPLKAWGAGELQSLRVYHTPAGGKGDELHQKESVGWKVNWGVGVLKNAFYYRVESAATAL